MSHVHGADKVLFVVLAVVILLGMTATVGKNLLGGGYDYRATIAVWFRGLLTFRPDPELMTDVPLIFQLHALSAWVLAANRPFTRLVHVWSAPIAYLWRPTGLQARAFAQVIGNNVPMATGGRSYGEISAELHAAGGDDEKPEGLRQTAFTGQMLRASLLNAYQGWLITTLVIGLGVLLTLTGAALLAASTTLALAT